MKFQESTPCICLHDFTRHENLVVRNLPKFKNIILNLCSYHPFIDVDVNEIYDMFTSNCKNLKTIRLGKKSTCYVLSYCFFLLVSRFLDFVLFEV